jgi:hypothetical protein
MDPKDMSAAFEHAQQEILNLRAHSTQFNQALGFISSVIETTKPYWVQLAAESQSAETQQMVGSGIATITSIGNALGSIRQAYTPPVAEAQAVLITANFFGSNTAATSSLMQIADTTQFNADAIPIQDFLADRTLATRFSKLDPDLGRACGEIWDCLYGTTADPERPALFMIRQTWDHLFEILAPDEEVRQSEFWKQKDAPRQDQVTREERFRFAVTRRVADQNKKELLDAACRQMLDLYAELNRAHKRGEIDPIRARQSLNSMYSWLLQWADALGI